MGEEENGRTAGGVPAARVPVAGIRAAGIRAEVVEIGLAVRAGGDDHNARLRLAFVRRRIGSAFHHTDVCLVAEKLRDFGVQIRRRGLNQNVDHAPTELLTPNWTATVRILS